ncbi:unnamed protein product [Symbiodinium natans]|uniref:Uncharacterized protein n=1 Tax=Symbiodinium natans TaxID=878477 RepID=A0A812JD92_9DINO|nr:unnamed protein product [Symbiodinium natans]
MVEREASELLQELGGRDGLPRQEMEDTLRLLLFRRFGAVGEEADWAGVSAKAIDELSEEAPAPHQAVRCAAAAFMKCPVGKEAASALVVLAEEGWEKAAGRLIKAAPPMAALGEWLAWEEVFAAEVGDLRAFLRREAPALGIFAFEVEGDFIKLDAASGTAEAFGSALAAQDAVRAAEAMLALVHSCGGLRSGPLQALQPTLHQASQSLHEAYPELMAQLLKQLPRPFRESPEVLRAVLEPLSEADLQRFAEAAPLLADRAAILGAVKARFLLRRATDRLAKATQAPSFRWKLNRPAWVPCKSLLSDGFSFESPSSTSEAPLQPFVDYVDSNPKNRRTTRNPLRNIAEFFDLPRHLLQLFIADCVGGGLCCPPRAEAGGPRSITHDSFYRFGEAPEQQSRFFPA